MVLPSPISFSKKKLCEVGEADKSDLPMILHSPLQLSKDLNFGPFYPNAKLQSLTVIVNDKTQNQRHSLYHKLENVI